MTRIKYVVLAFTFGLGLGYAMPALASPSPSACQYMADQCNAGDANACYNFNRLADYCHAHGIFLD